jgi:hypothetical protein
LRATGSQLFAHDRRGISDRQLPGTFDLYLHDAGGFIILWGVRMPDELEGKVYLLDLARAAAATLKVGASEFSGAAEPAAPKTSETKTATDDAPEAKPEK